MSEQTRKTQARMAERERRRQQQEQKEKLFRFIPFGIIAILVLVGVGLIVYGTTASPIAGGIGPRLEVDRDQIDLGTRKFDQPVRATFKVKNAGDNTLNLSVPKLVTAVEGCWPSEIVVGPTTLKPGESTTIYTDIVMHEGMGGKHVFDIPLKTNDPTQSAKTLRVVSIWAP